MMSIDEVVANAMTVIPEADDHIRLIARQWAYNALREIGPSKYHIKVEEIEPEDLAIKKPCDFVYGLDISFFRGDNEVLADYEPGRARIHKDVRLGEQYLQFTEDVNYYYISDSSEYPGITKVWLRYYATPVDKNGDPMFDDDFLPAIEAFIKFKMAYRNSSQDWPMHREVWKMELRRAKAKAKMPDELQMNKIATRWMSMIDKFNPYNF
jgi:hypothetical protein